MSIESPSRSSRICPPTLSTLPGELLIQIALHLDPASAVSFSRVSKSCAAPAELKIWRDLDFSIRPYDRDMLSFWSEAERGATARELMKHSGEWLRKRVKGCMKEASRRRYEMVESIRLEPRPQALIGMLQLLDICSPTLTTLEIVNNTHECIRYDVLPPLFETLDVQMLRPGVIISFPALTHLHLGEHAIQFMGLMFLLCDNSPNLISLDATISRSIDERWADDDDVPVFPTALQAESSIRQLRLYVRDLEEDDEDAEFEVLQEFLGDCVKVRELSLSMNGKKEEDDLETLQTLSQQEALQDL